MRATDGRQARANFFFLDNIRSMTDAELYDSLLREFPDWLKAAKEKGVL